jgi:hypothetical protein
MKAVDFPRRDAEGKALGQIMIRVLTQEEKMICHAAAEEVARKHMKSAKREDIGYEALYSDAFIVEHLFRACRDPDSPDRPCFPTPKAIQEQLTTDECSMLYQHYLTVQMELGPLITTMSEEEIDAWVERLTEASSAYPLDSLSSDLQRLVLLHLAFRVRALQTGNTFAGEQPEPQQSP